ncbi:MAG TPA: trypsin-like peptidase domain-containing protein [Bacillota bacterium]
MKTYNHMKKPFSLLMTLAFVLLSVTGATIGLANPALAASGGDLLGSSVVADIAEVSSPRVVWIETTYQNTQTYLTPFGLEQENTPAEGLGSGFFYDDNGYILTNAHVVANADSIEVTLKGQKTPLPATLVGMDQELDVAIIKVNLPNKITPLPLGDSDKTRIGDWVVAIGNPYGLDHTVTLGIISAVGRPISVGGNNTIYDDMIQTDAAINPGNSGGPLLDLKGEVIGINTAVNASGQGLGFAIPINTVKKILNELKTKGKLSHPYIGVSLVDVQSDPQIRAYFGNNIYGALVRSVVKDSPAAKAGLRVGDLIMAMDDQDVASDVDLVTKIRKHKIGDKINLLVMRRGSKITVPLTLGERPEQSGQ